MYVEAVIDKDLSSSLLAQHLGATTLIILTDIERIYLNFLGPRRKPVHHMSIEEAEYHHQRGEFLPGSMAPKVEAAISFLRNGGQRVLIGLPEELPYLLAGTAGTHIVRTSSRNDH